MSTRVEYTEDENLGVLRGHLRLSSDSGVNPLSLRAVETLRERIAACASANAPHLLLLSAEGRCFCAGADVKEFRSLDENGFRDYMTRILALYAEMIEAPRPIVCAVQADARGGGAALALCCDFVIAQRQAYFALPESLRGLAGGGYLMPRVIGKQMAAEMVLLGRDFSAEEMRGLGALNAICGNDDLGRITEDYCRRLAAIPPSAFGVGKRSLAGGIATGLREAMQWHVEAQTRAFVSARAEGRV